MTAPSAPISPRTIYTCCQDQRRVAIRAHGTLNGIDFLEVNGGSDVPLADRQRSLFVHFLKPLASGALTTTNVRIDGGERIPIIGITAVSIGSGDAANVLTVSVDHPGDFSTYTLSLTDVAEGTTPPAGFDPMLSSVDFSFKVDCPNDFDCAPAGGCPPVQRDEPEIDYLAKDFNSFRQLLFNRLGVIAPQWQERNPADLGVALVELLAYVGDYLSYQQDAVATEAYLGTARRRISVRRHTRLVDYAMHDGSNARAWVQINVGADDVVVDAHTQLLSYVAGFPPRLGVGSDLLGRALATAPVIFETMTSVTCYAAHDEIRFYTWGAADCCLPSGSTRATLATHLSNLAVGDILIFEEIVGPETGEPGDADPTHRQAVRLTSVALSNDPAGGRFPDPATGNDDPVDITEIEWAADDALTFPLCISATVDTTVLPAVNVARGNIVLADHGLTTTGESIGTVPDPIIYQPPSQNGDSCATTTLVPVPPRFTPSLALAPLTQAAPYDSTQPPPSAASCTTWSLSDVLPALLTLVGTNGPETGEWQPQRDLLASGPDDTNVVIEVDDSGTSILRFGNSVNGLRPASGTSFVASYRVGNGVAGNVGAEALAHVVSNDTGVVGVRNPLAANGGVEPETIESARQRAPAAFRTQERAVTPDDYANAAELYPGVQRAAATFRWTGSWRTVFVSVDRLCGTPVDDTFRDNLRAFLEPVRMAGYDLEIDAPQYVSLELDLQICVQPDYLRANVKSALLEKFSNHALSTGGLGVFHPDNWTFGQPVYLSVLYAAAQSVPGVGSVTITTLQRQGTPSDDALTNGLLAVNRLEIVRLDNDPSAPEHGVLGIQLDGGR